MKKRELDIPVADALAGSKLALANARKHLATADAIAAINEYGMACGHIVLAIEESAKAYFLACHSFGLPISKSLQKDVLSRHDFRHGMTNLNLLLMEINEIMLKHIILGNKEINKMRTIKAKREVRNRRVQLILSDIRILAEKGPNMPHISTILEWINTANEKKNAAFYVDYSAGSWKSPSDIDKTVFTKGRESAVKSIELHAKLVGLTLEMSHKEREDFITEIKENITKYPILYKFIKDA